MNLYTWGGPFHVVANQGKWKTLYVVWVWSSKHAQLVFENILEILFGTMYSLTNIIGSYMMNILTGRNLSS